MDTALGALEPLEEELHGAAGEGQRSGRGADAQDHFCEREGGG